MMVGSIRLPSGFTPSRIARANMSSVQFPIPVSRSGVRLAATAPGDELKPAKPDPSFPRTGGHPEAFTYSVDEVASAGKPFRSSLRLAISQWTDLHAYFRRTRRVLGTLT